MFSAAKLNMVSPVSCVLSLVVLERSGLCDSQHLPQLQISSLIQRCEDFGMPLQQMGAVRSLLLHAGADK